MPEMTTPPEAGGVWLCVGSYEHVAGLWLSPVTDEAKILSHERRNTSRQDTGQSPVTQGADHLSRERVALLMENCDPFVEALGNYDADYFAAWAPGRAAAEHPEYGRMPS